MVHTERAGGQNRVHELTAPVRKTGRVASRRPMVELEGNLLEAEAGSECVDRHPCLAAESAGDREAHDPGPLTHVALAGERFPWAEAGPQADEAARDPLGDSEPSADAVLEDGDREVGVALGERPERSTQVRVAEEQRARRRGTLTGGERLAFPRPVEPDHDCSCLLRPLGRRVRRPSDDHDHLGGRKVPPELRDRFADPALLVPRRDEDATPQLAALGLRRPEERLRRWPCP